MKYSYKILPETAQRGNPVGELSVELNVADIGSSEEVKVDDAFPIGAKIVSCQVVGEALAGTLNGTAQLTQSNDGGTYSDITGAVTTLNTAAFSDIIEKVDFVAKFAGVTITKGGLTAGTIRLIFVVKH